MKATVEALAVGPRDMDNRRQPAMRRTEISKQPLDAIEHRSDLGGCRSANR